MKLQQRSRASSELLRGLEDCSLENVLSVEDLRRFDQLAREVKDTPDPRFVIRLHLSDSRGWYLWARYRVGPLPATAEITEEQDVQRGSRGIITHDGLDFLTNDPNTLPEEVRFSVPTAAEGLPAVAVVYAGRADWKSLIRVFHELHPDHLAAKLGRVAYALEVRGKHQQAIKVHDRALEALRDVDDTAPVQGLRAAMMVYRGEALESVRPADALAAYDEVIGRYGSSMEPFVRARVARSMLNRAGVLCTLGSQQAGINAYQTIIDTYRESTEPDILEQVAFASFNRSEQFRQLGRTEVASSGFAETADRFLKEKVPEVLRVGIAARVEQAMLRSQEGDFRSALDLLDSLITLVGNAEDAALQEEIARAMREFARALAGVGDIERAREVKAEMQERFGESDDQNVQRFLTQVDDLMADPTLF